jgi:hypothetical protein
MKVRKVCARCHRTKAESAFGKDRSQKDGLQILCRVCRKSYYLATRERWRAEPRREAPRKRPELIPDSEVFLKSFVASYEEIMFRNYGKRSENNIEEKQRERVRRCQEIFESLLPKG